MSEQLRAVQPPQAPPPFPEPVLLSARRVTGTVLTPPQEKSDEAGESPLTSLDRKASISGNILLIDVNNNEPTKAFLLQRKIKTTVFGIVRVGYVLKDAKDTGDGVWEVAASSSGNYQYEMVEISIEDKSKITNSHGNTAQDPKTEISALQLVAAHDPEGKGHVEGTSMIATDQRSIYTITPFHKEGSLFSYCAMAGKLSEKDARFFFRQILEGLATLQTVELCHRSLSLEKIHLQGKKCSLVGLASALRIPTAKETGAPHMIEAQPAIGSDPRYVAPELLAEEPFDGYAVDLWSAGVMLFVMLLGSDDLFAAPVPEDRRFHEICVRERLKASVEERRKRKPADVSISDDAVDLLQKMLRANPKARLTLGEVKKHPWVVGNCETDSSTPNVPLQSDILPKV